MARARSAPVRARAERQAANPVRVLGLVRGRRLDRRRAVAQGLELASDPGQELTEALEFEEKPGGLGRVPFSSDARSKCGDNRFSARPRLFLVIGREIVVFACVSGWIGSPGTEIRNSATACGLAFRGRVCNCFENCCSGCREWTTCSDSSIERSKAAQRIDNKRSSRHEIHFADVKHQARH